MIDYNEAIEIIKANCPQALSENIAITKALGKILAQDIIAPLNIPSFNNSAMDGFGIRLEQLAQLPARLKNLGAIGAGDIDGDFAQNGAIHIMTGAKIPPFIEAIIPIENVIIENEEVIFSQKARMGENIRYIGEDVTKGNIIIKQGTKIASEHIMQLAALGIAQISVLSAPEIKIIATGNELVAHDSGDLKDGKIYNSNAPYLMARTQENGLFAHATAIIEDEKTKFICELLDAKTNQIIISTGAVSAGKFDFVPDALREIGAKIHFHKVNIRPGKPIIFATLPNGNLFFGLPGNPISSAIGFQFFVEIAIAYILGQKPPMNIMAQLENNFNKKNNLLQFVKASFNFENGALKVHINDGQESFKISPLIASNTWAILPNEKREFKAGEMVAIRPFHGLLP